jgi:pimeloyl-ACP methyl ester carboxylesterase
MAVVELAWDDSGTGPPVVLLHAYPVHRSLLTAQREALSASHRVITPDLRGFGASRLGDDEPSLGVMADDVAALLDRLGVARAVVGGVSMGGYVAMALVRRHPDRVSGLLLIDTKASADAPAARENRLRVAAAVTAQGPAALLPMVENLLGATTRATRPDVVATVRGWIAEVDPAAAAWAQRAMAARPDSFDSLRAAGLPGAVVVGEEDTITPHDEALALAEALGPHAVVHVVPRAGHLTPVEAPEATNAALRDALRHLAAPPA